MLQFKPTAGSKIESKAKVEWNVINGSDLEQKTP